jgi:hypothetical protein
MTKENLIWCNGSQKYIPSHLCEDGLNCEECEYYSEESNNYIDDDGEV